MDTHENVCREGFGYLWALSRLPPQRNGLLIFTQAKLKLKQPQAFNHWLAAVRAAQHECFSFFGGVIPGRVSTTAYGSSSRPRILSRASKARSLAADTPCSKGTSAAGEGAAAAGIYAFTPLNWKYSTQFEA